MVGEILVVTRRAAIDAVNGALSGVEASKANAASTRRGRGSSQPRRTPEELAELREKLYAQLAEAPGEGMARYAGNLGLPRQPGVPAKQLKKLGRVRTVGERDRTRYFPMGSA